MSDFDAPKPPEGSQGASNNPFSHWNDPPPSGYKPFTSGGTGFDAFKKWLGDKGFKEFQKTLCQSISDQMKTDQEIMDKASRKLKAAAKGENPDDVD